MSTSEITVQDLKNLCINASQNIFRMLNEKDGFENNDSPNLETKLIFPQYEREAQQKDKTIRYSEQEARVQFILALERYYKEIFYSIETPTDYRYSFSGQDIPTVIFSSKKGNSVEDSSEDEKTSKGSSALFDLSLFVRDENHKLKQDVNIEFKSHNPAMKTIQKDLLKLLVEPTNCLFFHLLDSVDSGTLTSGYQDIVKELDPKSNMGILSKYRLSFKELISSKQELIQKKQDSDEYILFFIVSIHPKFILAKTVSKTEIFKKQDIFDMKYTMKNTERNERAIKSIEAKGWDFIDFS